MNRTKTEGDDADVDYKSERFWILQNSFSTCVCILLVKLDMCTELLSLEVKAFIRFSGTVGFPPSMEGR